MIEIYGFDPNFVKPYFYASTYTSADGSFCFLNLDPYLVYTVREALAPEGWMWVSPIDGEYSSLTASGSGVDITDVNFLNVRLGSICGYKYEDKDLSGTINTGDVTVPYWEVLLYVWNGIAYEYLDITLTGLDGKYCFTDLDPYQKYAVYESDYGYWTKKIIEHEDLVFSSSGGMIDQGTSFLNAQNINICGYKFEDLDLDGMFDWDTDVPVDYWEFDLWYLDVATQNWVWVDWAGTDANGRFCFLNLDPYLTYKVEESFWLSAATSWTPVPPTEWIVTPDMSGQTIVVEFLNAQNIDICGYKLEDTDLNGEFELGKDAPVANWKIDIYGYDVAGSLIFQDSTMTEADGSFCFLNLNPYLVYDVFEDLAPAGWMWVSPLDGQYLNLQATGSGVDISYVNFLNAEEGSICGTKYEDMDLSLVPSMREIKSLLDGE